MFEPCKTGVESLSNSLTQATAILPPWCTNKGQNRCVGTSQSLLRDPALKGPSLAQQNYVLSQNIIYSVQKMLNKYLTLLNENKIMNHSII